MPAHPKASTVAQPDQRGEEIAIAALGFLAGDDERLSRFLALTGIDPASIRQQIGDPLFQLAILDHVFEDESLLLAFCTEIAARTEQYWCPIKHARKVLHAHPYYMGFADFGDAKGYQTQLEALNARLAALQVDIQKGEEPPSTPPEPPAS
jgi:hypothetical protein